MEQIARAHQLVCRYDNNFIALNGVSFSIPRGAQAALLGANGAGKSTLLLCLSGLLPAYSGDIEVCGLRLSPQRKNPSLLGRVGLVFQDPDDQLFGLTVADDVAMGPRAMRLAPSEVNERTYMALEAMGITHLSERQPHLLSLGEKRRVALAGVLAMSPELVLLDEPTAYLDSASLHALEAALELLANNNISLMIATHDVDFAARWAEQVILLKNGQVLVTGERNLLTDKHLMSAAGLRLPIVTQTFADMLPPNAPLPMSIEEGRACLQKLLDLKS